MELIRPTVLSKVVDQDLCIGCGVCVQACPNNALDMQWNEYGFLVAVDNGGYCDQGGACIKVCPFNPDPDENYKNEDQLSEVFLKDSPELHEKIGRYHNLYAGYSNKHRTTSSSGGIATFFYEKLFDKGVIKHVVTVGESLEGNAHYQYNIVSKKEDLTKISKTKYHPVTLANVLQEIKKMDGAVAISGVGCFIKAIRLAQSQDPVLKEKIKFLVGIICGGVKSKFFTDYLATKAGAALNAFSNPNYRVKNENSTAIDYSFSCFDKAEKVTKVIRMREVGDMWGTGFFKANACDFCDDVTTELADLSLGDAWLRPYDQDGRGHNVIVSRSYLAEQILLEGEKEGTLKIEKLPLEKFLASQQGSFNHRHDGLGYRLEIQKRENKAVLPKRFKNTKLPLYLKIVQSERRKTRAKSLLIWKKYSDPFVFDKKMKNQLFKLRLITKFSHLVRKIKK